MKNITLLFHSIILLLITGLAAAQAQNCSLLTGQGGLLVPDKTCAPVMVTLEAYFPATAGPDVMTDVKIRVDWADGTPAETFPASAVLNSDGKTWRYEIKNITHTYPKGGKKCNYSVVARPVINGVVCSAFFFGGNVTVWDTDDSNGGVISINPKEYLVCPGDQFLITFRDNSTWNCTPPIETGNTNYPTRWTQFVYGTNQTPGTRIAGILIDGVSQPSPFYDIAQQKQHDPMPGDPPTPPVPDHETRLITVPATAQVGEVYEITLRNWNACNPYDNPAVAGGPANVRDGDFAPVTTTAIIRIVARPEGTITTRNKDNVISDNFCPAERVRFEGQQTKAGVTNVQYDWFIYNDATGTELLEEKKNTKSWNRDAGFPTAGQKLIVLRIRNKDAANSCWAEITKIINVYAAPQAAPFINGVAGSSLEMCWNDAPFSAAFDFKLFSSNNYKFQIGLYKRNSIAVAPDSTLFTEQLVSGGQSPTASHNTVLNKPGVYKVRLLATDRVTGCTTIQESQVLIWGKPKAAFTFANICQGQPVVFTNASTLPFSIQGDTLQSWQWDVNYDGTNFTPDYTGKTPAAHTYPAAGTYQVALLVTTSKGCTDMLVKSVEVKPVPIAALTYNYTQPICPGEPILFTNISSNDASKFPAGISYTLVVSDQLVTNRYPMPDLTRQQSFTNASSALKTYSIWLEAKANNPNNCAMVSDTLKVAVKPGSVAGFLAPAYDALQPNCSPLDLVLITNQATRDIKADRYTWTITQAGVEVKKLVQNRGDAGFDTLTYSAINNTSGSLTYTVRLVAEKANQCITPAEEKYRVNPVPVSAFTVTQINQTCEQTVLEVQVNSTTGISKYNWTIFPEPDNAATVVYDDKFQLVYKRPSITSPSYDVDLSLVTYNFFECPSPATAKKATIQPQRLDEVKVVVISPENTGCSPLTVEFENQTVNPPAGTIYTVLMRHGSAPEQELIPFTGDAASRFTYKFIKEGNYQIWLKATAPDGCMRYQTVPAQVVVYPGPKPYFSVDNTAGCGPLTVSINKANITGTKRSWTVTDLSNNQIMYGPAVFDPASGDTFSYITLSNTGTADKQYRIYLQTETAEGCKADSSLIVTVYTEPKASFDVVGGTNLCDPYTIQVKNTSTNPVGTVYTWEWGDGTTTTSTNTTISKTYTNTSYASTLTFPVRLTSRTPSGCTAEHVVQVSVAPRVLADFDADRQTGCAPLQVNFTNRSRGNAEGYSGWFIKMPGSNTYEAKGNVLNNFTFDNTTSATLVYGVRYIAGNAAACADTLERQITVHPLVLPQITADVAEGCGPLVVNFRNQNVQPNVRYTWQWSDGSSDEITTSAVMVQHTFENASTTAQRRYTVRIIAENTVTGCTASTTHDVTVFARVQASVTPSQSAGCSPLQLNVQNNSQNAESHFWQITRKDTGTEVFTSTNAVPDMPVLNNETAATLVYELSYRASSAQGCSSQQKFDISVYPAVAADFSMDKNAACGPAASITFTNNSIKAGMRYTWQWGDGSSETVTTTEASLQHTFENYSTSLQRQYTVRLTAEDPATGCKATTSKVVLVYPQVQAQVVPSTTQGCAPLQLSFQNNTQNAQTHAWRVIRKDTGLEIFAGTNSIPDLPLLDNSTTAPLVYEVTYTATSGQGCSSSQKHEITVFPGVAAAFDMDINASACGPTKVVFSNVNVQAGVQYTWQWGDGSVNVVTTTETQIEHTFTNDRVDRSRFYEVTLTATNPDYGCTSVYRKTVTVYPAVQVTVAPDKNEICAPGQINFTNRSQNVSSHEWWYRLQGSNDKLEVRQSAEVQYQFTNATSAVQQYEVLYVGTSSTGCSDTAIHAIAVHPELVPSFTLDTDQPSMPDGLVNITNTTQHADSWTTSWDFGDGTSSNQVHPGSKRYSRYGTYKITLIISNGFCTKTYSREVQVGDMPPRVDFESIPVSGCEPLFVQFKNTSTYADTTTFEWTFGDGATSRAVNPSHTFYTRKDSKGNLIMEYTVTLSARNYTGEKETIARKVVTVYPLPKASFRAYPSVVKVPGEAVEFLNSSENADTYLWDFGDGNTSSDKNPIHYYQQPGIYDVTLVVTNQWGCTDTLKMPGVVTAEAGGKIVFPNAFTPDITGPSGGYLDPNNMDLWKTNDIFMPVLSGGVSKFNMRIYNRWGELIFESKDRNIGWDGYYKGQLCKADVYAYKIYVEFSDGQNLQKIGDLTLIR